MSKTHALGASALFLGFCSLASASEPASHDVTVPTSGNLAIEWTGTAQPGAQGAGNSGGLADPAAAVGCQSNGVDDEHVITMTVPAGAYDGRTVTADFQITWGEGEDLVIANGHDLALTVFRDGEQVGTSDGGDPQETVSLVNPEAGEYTVVVCPFTANEPVDYRGTLKMGAADQSACAVDTNPVNTNGALAGGGATVYRPELRGLPNYDRFLVENGAKLKPIPTHVAGRLQPAIYDRALGTPTFLWAKPNAPIAAVGPIADQRELLVAHARAHLRSEAKLLKLDAAAIDEAQVFDARFNGQGPAVVRFRQSFAGLPVMHRSLNVLLDKSFRPVAVSGYFANGFDRAATPAFALNGAQAIATAWRSLGGELSVDALRASRTVGEWQWFERPLLEGTHWFEREPRARQVMFPAEGALIPAWQVELLAKAKRNGNLMAHAVTVSALDGAILQRKDLKSDAAFSYRTFADAQGPVYQPYDSPLGNGYAPLPEGDRKSRRPRVGTPTQMVTLEHASIVTGDPWLAEGATQTTGNNVDACIDEIDQGVDTPAGGLAVPPPVNSCLEDVEPRAQVTSPGTFDYPLVADENPESATAKSGAAVNLFYMNNWLHDWWYNHGFDEASGNAQADNYGRGGEEGDPILAQGQDASGRNNANMATPGDGSSPVMQQYLFDGPLLGEVRQVAPIAGQPLIFTTIANAGSDDHDVTGALALANDGAGVSDTDGCGEPLPGGEVTSASPVAPPAAPLAPPDPNLQGKIALVDRGNCNTTFKAQFAIASGAIGVIVVNNQGGDPPGNIGNLDVPLAPVPPTEPVYSDMPIAIIRKDDGEALKAQLAAGADVQMHMARSPSVDTDGTLDNQIIAHEFFHYVHHRLTDSGNQQAGAMSEGWGDINGFMLTVRADDKFVPGNAAFGQPYALAHYVADDFLKGIRRVPYSTAMADNAYTLRHIADGEVEPNGGAGASNSEVHAAGEIWANEMFECYAGILSNPKNSFSEAQGKMRDYIIGGFKMTPADATFTEARDAVLAVVRATDFDDYKRCSNGFAKRGSGLRAVAPARSSSDLVGVVEDFTPFVCEAGARDGETAIPESSGVLLGGSLGGSMLLPLLGLGLLRRRRR
ncbi:MAG TPA: M36 family metallopeptidase [Verrucomicrobiae bacterium]|nr:M36 family metallopeptidase [Verrucomicrobiae bacterium]